MSTATGQPPTIAGAIQAPPIGWGGQIGAARAALHQAIADRAKADLRVSYTWVILFLVGPFIQTAILGFAVLVFFSTGQILLLIIFGLIGLLTGTAIHGVINRTLIRRMTRHFDREVRLRGALIEYLHAKAAEEQKLNAVASSLLQMAMLHGQAQAEDRGRSVLWSLATSLPFIRYYFLWFISKFPYEHEQRFLRFLNHAGQAAAGLGVPFQVPALKPVKRHRFWLFLLLSLLTNEWFIAFWYLVLIREPHIHFDNHVQADDALSLALH
ncbi:MAG TPA: hypothetical protein VJ547_06190 [Candidatus Thermoplasmatota archaeon]|nr:hypothetical protein [Candidatus Thermoplasmatota archaeon]